MIVLFYLLLASGFATAACVIGVRLALVPRSLAWLQLSVAALLLQCFLCAFPWPVYTTLMLASIICGGGVGYALRLICLRDAKEQAHFFELGLRNQELQEARLQMIKQDEIDRRILAADLHDQVLNDLKSLGQKIHALKANPTEEHLTVIEGLLQHSMSGIREVMDSLYPAVLEHLGLPAALEDCLRKGSEKGGYRVRFKSTLSNNELKSLDRIEQTLLYRLGQECVNNIVKHACANMVRGTIDNDQGHLLIRIRDDGIGIDRFVIKQESRGLCYMKQRANLIGATIGWLNTPEIKGTTVEIRMPLRGSDYASSIDR